MASSVIAFLPATANSSASAIKDQINKAKELVSEEVKLSLVRDEYIYVFITYQR